MKSSTIGKPKYTYGDEVSFKLEGQTRKGTIYIVDAYGTFEKPDEVSYDILSKDESILYKHIPESLIL